jgi:hypothetical protein
METKVARARESDPGRAVAPRELDFLCELCISFALENRFINSDVCFSPGHARVSGKKY